MKRIYVIEKCQWQYKLKATWAHLPITLKNTLQSAASCWKGLVGINEI